MSSLEKQLVINSLKLPREIIRIINDYTFMDTIMSNSKKKKNTIIQLINNTIWCGRARPKDIYNGITIFWIEEDYLCPQFQSKFCKKCGNYESLVVRKLLCQCDEDEFLTAW